MSNDERTPGPWSIEGDRDWFNAVDERGFAVAEAMTEPDARLIAAAPDLLAALYHVVNNIYPGCDGEWHFKGGFNASKIFDAIYKADRDRPERE